MMKILVNTPSLKFSGGVSNHFKGLKNYWSVIVKYNTVGKRGVKRGSGKYWLPWDLLKFVFKLYTFKPNIVLINPSLTPNAIKRDSIFLNIAVALDYKVAIFLHGFNWDYARSIDKIELTKIFNKASLIIVLGNIFRKELQSWGITSPIVLSTTKVDDKLLDNFEIESRMGKVNNLLYLARVEKAKGIYETLEVFELLKLKYPHLRFTVVGDGTELSEIKQLVREKNLSDVSIMGELSGDALIDAFKSADLYIFLSYSEGMPASVLEAMAFGLPVITRKVGALSDFFENGKMGFITDSLSPQDFADVIVSYINDANLTRKVSLYNHKYAQEHFMASAVCRRIENELIKII